MLQVIHDRIDADIVKPDVKAPLRLPNSDQKIVADDEVVTIASAQ